MEKDSVRMHKKLFRSIGDELPYNCQEFKNFEHFINLSPRDKDQNNKSAEDLLKVWENQGGIYIGCYDQLLRVLKDAGLIKLHGIVTRQINLIMTQLSIEGKTPTTGAKITPGSSRDRVVSNGQSETSGDLKLIQRELLEWYINTLSRFHPLPWSVQLKLDLDHIFTNLEMVPEESDQKCKRLKFDYGDIQTLSSIFNRDSSKRSVCLIEGPAGIGKSILCTRLVYLWSNNNFSIGDRFVDLALLLEAKFLTGNLKKCMTKQLFPEDFDVSEDNIYECLRNHQKTSLLIIDGIDELTSEGKTLVMGLLNGHRLRHVNLLLTGRPDASREFIKYANLHFKINGFSIQNVKQYICKYFNSNNNKCKDTLLNRLERDNQLESIMANPFTTLSICVLVEDHGGVIPENFTEILDEVLRTLCEIYVKKKEKESVTTCSSTELLSAAGHLAYNGLKQEMTAYPEETLSSFCPDGFRRHLLESGILCKNFTVSRLYVKSVYYFPHKCFQEFLCANHLAALNLEELKRQFSEILRKRTGEFLDKNMIRFLLDMLQCQSKIKIVLESLCQKIGKMSSLMMQLSAVDDLLDLYGSDRTDNLLEPLAQLFSTCEWVLSAISFNYYVKHTRHSNMSDEQKDLIFRKSIHFFQKCIRKMMLPPAVVVSDGKLFPLFQKYIWERVPLHVSSVTERSTEVRTYIKQFVADEEKCLNHTAVGMHFPRHRYLLVGEPSSLCDTGILDITWPFVHCGSAKVANDILAKDIKVSVLTILLIPGNVTVEDTKALVKSLTSTDYNVAVLFLVLEDIHDDQHFVKMLKLFSSLRNISFLKMRPAVPSFDECDGFMVRRYLLDCPIYKMYYSKCCPY